VTRNHVSKVSNKMTLAYINEKHEKEIQKIKGIEPFCIETLRVYF